MSAKLFVLDAAEKIGSGILLLLPKSASEKLPSRGMTMVEGTINDFPFQAALEPDGNGSHWFKVKKALLDAARVEAGDMVALVIEPTKDWPEPKVPADFKTTLEIDQKAQAVWQDITPMARWDWIRWIGATRNPDTRKRRVEVARSKLSKGMRRPCCFNRTECTLTDA
jgi:hypothetical protein